MTFRDLVQDLRELPLILGLVGAVRDAHRPGATCGALIRRQAERLPDRPCLRFETEELTFRELNRLVNRFARLLSASGVGRGDRVAILMENSPAMLAAEGAIGKLGAVGALLNTHLSGEALRHVLGASGARRVIVDAACAAPMAALRDLEGLTVWADPGAVPLPPRFRSLPEELAGASEEEPDVAEPGLDDVFLYVYTSGTTGYPKPAVVRHSRFTLAGATLQRIFDVDRDDCIYAPLPLYHGESNFVGFALALRAGACFASRRRFRASEFLADVRRHRATGFVYVGELCRYLLRRPATAGDRDHALRWAAGAGLRPEIWREFQDRFGVRRIYEMYGATEGNVSLLNRTGRVGSVGRPFPFQHDHVKLARLDLSTEELIRGDDGFLVECTAGESGELLGRTDRGRMRYDGYAGDPVASERKLVRSAFAPGDAWFRSGDLLRRDRDGYFHFVDRIGDTFRWRGENVSAQEVADVMQEAPGIGHAAAYGVRIADAEGRGGMSAVALCAASTFDGGRVYEHVARGLPSYAQPLFLRIVDAVETTGTLKPRTVRYRAEGFDPRSITDALYVRDDGARAYVPLTAEAYDAIQSGRRRL